MARTAAVAVVAAAGVLATPARSAASIDIDPTASDADKAALADCLKETQNVPGVSDIVNKLTGPGARNVRITLSKDPLSGSSTPTDPANAGRAADGTPGSGSDSTLVWNPNDHSTYRSDPALKNDPCATLLHELKHSLDFAQGIDDGSENDSTGVSNAEVGGTAAENRYRAAKGLRQRTKYGPRKLPDDVIVQPSGPAGGSIRPPRPREQTPGGGGGGTTGGTTGTTGGGTTGGDTTGTTGGGTTGTTGGGTTGTTGSGTTGTTGGGTTGGGTTGTTGGGTTGGDSTDGVP